MQAEAGKYLQTAWVLDAAHCRGKLSQLFSWFNNKIHSADMKKLIIKPWIYFPLPEAKSQIS